MRTSLSTIAVLGLALGAAPAPAGHCCGGGGDACPAPTLRLVVPFPPGGPPDMVARNLAAPLGTALGKTVVVENRAGGGGTLAAAEVARGSGDGCTWLLSTRAPIVLNPAIGVVQPSFDPGRDLLPVAQLAEMPFVLATRPNARWRNIAELRQAAGAGGHYGSTGHASFSHFAGALLARAIDRPLGHVPYRGAGPLLADLQAGNIDLAWVGAGSALPDLRAGRLRALAVTGRSRLPVLPDVPTTGEAGLGAVDIVESLGLYVPARGGVERHAGQIAALALQAAASPDLRDRMQALGLQPAGLDAAAFAASMRDDAGRWARHARVLDLK